VPSSQTSRTHSSPQRAASGGGAKDAPARDTGRVLEPFDYSAPAELFYNGSSRSNRKMSYRRFPTAAEAIAFAVEELGAAAIGFATLVVDEDRFERRQIRRLYDAPDYPLIRAAAVA
jgi:hypothetical protein